MICAKRCLINNDKRTGILRCAPSELPEPSRLSGTNLPSTSDLEILRQLVLGSAFLGDPIVIASVLCLRRVFMLARLYLYSFVERSA
jgi:hypothetical protein